jgi:hypothetical protein
MDLPPRAQALYSTWWSFVSYAAHAVDAAGAFLYNLIDVSSAASSIAKSVGGDYANYNPIGISQLFSVARGIAKTEAAIRNADPNASIDESMVVEAPWSRPLIDQLAMPSWQARSQVTYINEAGQQVTEWFTVGIDLVLPSTVGDLQNQLASSLDSMLTAPPKPKSPRRGQLISVDAIQLLSV